VIISNARKLAESFEFRNLYIKADETLEERRKSAIRRFYSKAVSEYKNAVISSDGGQLTVDGISVFWSTLNDGLIRCNGKRNS
jgi:hypothetical protein